MRVFEAPADEQVRVVAGGPRHIGCRGPQCIGACLAPLFRFLQPVGFGFGFAFCFGKSFALFSQFLLPFFGLFLGLGGYVERADMTLRLLDVKSYVLLPETEVVGGGRDHRVEVAEPALVCAVAAVRGALAYHITEERKLRRVNFRKIFKTDTFP